jgi:hypothetical protein
MKQAPAHIRNGQISFGARREDPKRNTPDRSFVIAGKRPAKSPFSADLYGSC